MRIAAIIVAGGSGSRASRSLNDIPKQYVSVGGQPMLARTLRIYETHPQISRTLTVIRDCDADLYQACSGAAHSRRMAPVHGGETRQQSVLNGLRALKDEAPDFVLIHDAARPFITHAIIDRVILALRESVGAIAATPVVDTLKRGAAGMIEQTVDRVGLWGAQTPQGFRFADILEAHEAAAMAGRTQFSDDASIAEWRGLRVALVDGSRENWKITTAEDLARADRVFMNGWETRLGTGFDVHSFEPGDFVTLCGVRVKHTHKLNGHSDSDAPLHALTDALLGAIGAGDIGDHFPPSDMQWKGADSAIFLRHARDLIAARGGRIVNVDLTILAERPKIAPHRGAMRACVAGILEIDIDRVGLKATTMETLGFIGRREGLAAMASASVALPMKSDGMT